LKMEEPSMSEAVYSSLKPDNVGLPAGLGMEMKIDGCFLELRFVSSITDTLISTVDDVFEACGVSLLAIHSAEG
jgi:hypothetical protein